MNPIERTTSAYISGLFLLGICLAIFNPNYFDAVYTREDGFLETATVLALLTACIASIQRFRTLYAGPTRTFIPAVAFVILISAFGAGEEISWGQRLLNIESHDFFKAHNAQQETNLHNMVVQGTKINQLIFGKILGLGLLIYLAVLTPLYHRNTWVRQQIWRFAIPVPKHYQILGYALVFIGVEGVMQLFSDTARRGELTEFAASFVFMLNVAFPVNQEIERPYTP